MKNRTSNQLINNVLLVIGGVKRISQNSHRNRIGLFIDFCYSFLRYGCLPRHFLHGGFWNKTNNDRKDILTYRKFVKLMMELNNPELIHILENKAEFNKYFAEYIHRYWIVSLNADAEEIKKFIIAHKYVIVKPIDAMEGHGIYKLNYDNIADIDAECAKLSKQNFIIEEILQQHHSMVLGNKSVNTIRVHTLIDKTGKAQILSCVLRAGVGDSVVDNYCSGGVIYPLNAEYGIVDGSGVSRAGSGHIKHPQTEIIMIGFKVPNWEVLTTELKKAAEKIPEIRLIGWDVAITENGIALIEGNHNPDYELYEFIGKGKSFKQIKDLI